MARFYRNMKYYIGFGTAGNEAYKVSNVWKLGFHLFENGGYRVFRICYFRTDSKTYYWQFEKRKTVVTNIQYGYSEEKE